MMRRRRGHVGDTVGDGGLFLALSGELLCFLALLGVSTLTGAWVGRSLLEIGLIVPLALVMLVLVLTSRDRP
ncbi:hypothetical protein FB471_4888 [Amycolatopsis cihanbeyliensis]|uniref:Uncharacterized protein n=2 Tax=Amycolatopsis cihanbeyliensis TaxID=1128664 RepID=A0A542DPS3_AMYCI|nr:hypothetical protein FB471_4888 [Amycolatopsis cihanbeyliensis]